MAELVLYHGDCLDVLGRLDAESVDAVVTDPPYGLEFMGKEWDRFRVDDPGRNHRHRGEHAGAHGGFADGPNVAFKGDVRGTAYGGGKRARTFRCTACGKRDQFRNRHYPCGDGDWRAELVDPFAAPPTMLAFQEWCRQWSTEALRVLRPGGYMLAFGGTRTYHRLAAGVEDAGFEIRDSVAWLYGQGFPKSHNVGEGVGTALKPAHEQIVVARKPLRGSVAQNLEDHGTGVLRIDAARLPMDDADRLEIEGSTWDATRLERVALSSYADDGASKPMEAHPLGRWPANVALDDRAAALLDRATGDPVSRFFYTSKATARERNKGLGHLEPQPAQLWNEGGIKASREATAKPKANTHPTVKPVDLMQWLVRLVTPPDGVVLDPFAGSGTTGVACRLEHLRCILIEAEADYLPIIAGRLGVQSTPVGSMVLERTRIPDPEPVTRRGARRFACPHCALAFTDRSLYARHWRSRHDPRRPPTEEAP